MPEKHLPSERSKPKYQTTPHPGEIDLKLHRLIFYSHSRFIWRRNENFWEPQCPIQEYLPAKMDKK